MFGIETAVKRRDPSVCSRFSAHWYYYAIKRKQFCKIYKKIKTYVRYRLTNPSFFDIIEIDCGQEKIYSFL